MCITCWVYHDIAYISVRVSVYMKKCIYSVCVRPAHVCAGTVRDGQGPVLSGWVGVGKRFVDCFL